MRSAPRLSSIEEFLEDLNKNGLKFRDGTKLQLIGWDMSRDVQMITTWQSQVAEHLPGPVRLNMHAALSWSPPTKCKSAGRYQGKRKPRCMGGKGCDTCRAKYKYAAEAAKAEERRCTEDDSYDYCED